MLYLVDLSAMMSVFVREGGLYCCVCKTREATRSQENDRNRFSLEKEPTLITF